jgi:hypothetical protein
MTDAADHLPDGFTPSEELMFEKAECAACGLKVWEKARAWAHQHVRETGHATQLSFGYDVRDEHWESRLPYDRIAEIEALRSREP